VQQRRLGKRARPPFAAQAAEITRMSTPDVRARWSDTLFSNDPKRRIRLQQWLTTLAIYVASGGVMALGVHHGLIGLHPLLAWAVFVLGGLGVFYGLIRWGFSERLRDPALTSTQIVFGMLTVCWGYLMCGEVRSATVCPMMVILTFGAFSLPTRRIALLTAGSLALLTLAMLVLHRWQPGRFNARVDIANLLIAAIMLPASCVVAGHLSTLRGRLRKQRTALTEALQQIAQLASRDELTGLVNRRCMQESLMQAHYRVQREGACVCIALLDLDHFKSVNDRFGHAAGDAVLHTFAQIAAAAVRSSDTLARWGGEEFLLMAPDAQPHQIQAILDRLRCKLGDTAVPGLDAGFRVTFSAGVVSSCVPDTLPQFIARADQALYRAKSHGRNQVVVG
jgi:diguanylate cyclase